ncbi:acetyltransferase [Thermococcus celericrescens]|uniref:Acetyltransferase n=1 Tax=Thermococcus celericrescens TaxID=227598 RepID=A0A100XZP5_9EURY|nr:GNAT family N-acetyltransferase [Thermococcus celericrescens]KUH34709.1 acetyltransferase [Thermococcus celericrescens]
MRIETSRDNVKSCLEIAKELPEWFNEAGLRAMGWDLRVEKTFVAVEGEEVLGFVTVKPLNEKALEILWMAVRRELRGKGIGTKLLEFVDGWAKESGFKLLVVKTSGDLSYRPYDKTRRFYERRGFVRVALIDPYPEWGEPALIYVKCPRNV